jgi:flagellar hook-basal body complex protein FliE
MNVDRMQSVLVQLRSLAAEASGSIAKEASSAGAATTGAASFAQSLQGAVEALNQRLQSAEALQQRFSAGATDVELSDVMLATQKAGIAFQAALQVRNKLVSAYQDIMNIQA